MGIKSLLADCFQLGFPAHAALKKDVAVQQRSAGKVPLQDFQFGDIYEVERLAVPAAQRWQQLAEIQPEQVHL